MSLQLLLDETIPGWHMSTNLVVIVSLDNGEILAKFEENLPSEISQDELKTICYNFLVDLDSIRENGIIIGGLKYESAGADTGDVMCRNDHSVLRIRQAKKSIVIVASEELVYTEEVIEKFIDQLKNLGY